ncbi:MAG: A/G-specific adenine glycosylase [Treponema sp.]|jgi:A/G-specific adenine glycosylase|nr:A/G-specific adenine glycosylase [Treponema sp.]
MFSSESISAFKTEVNAFFTQQGRSFPWRENTTPWGVAVSEFMLQQTQTERVTPFFKRWMERWPTPAALADASLEDALREWVGLGYNKRCRFLKECARVICVKHGGKVPETPAELTQLPGVGAYTAGAVACFAYNYPSVFIETNIRATILNFFFKDAASVSDKKLVPILEEALDRENPRQWYWALMDYGAALKKTGENPSRRSAHYAKQSTFDGSFRQLRGKVVRSLAIDGKANAEELAFRTGIAPDDLYRALSALNRDSIVAEQEGVYQIRER